MKRALKIFAVLMCIVLMCGIVTACGDDDSKEKKDSSSQSVSDPALLEGESIAEDVTKDEFADDSNSSGAGKSNSNSDKNSSGSKNSSGGNAQGSGGNGENNVSGGSGSGNANSNASGSNSSNASGGKSNNGKSGNGNSSSSNSNNSSGNKNTDSKSGGNSSSSSSKNRHSKLNGDEKSFVITCYPKIAPKTCSNFIELVDSGFYDGLIFTRVINDFLAQAGARFSDGTMGSGKTIIGEFANNGFNNSLSHTSGVVSMYRTPEDPNSADSQFFICYNDNCRFMDGNYAAFGKVTSGYSVVQSFQALDRETGYDGTKSRTNPPIKIFLAERIEDDSNGNPQVKFYVRY